MESEEFKTMPPSISMSENTHHRKHDIHLIPESAMLLSRVLEREARKQSVLKRFRPSMARRLGIEITPPILHQTIHRTRSSTRFTSMSRVSPEEQTIPPETENIPTVQNITVVHSTLRNRIWIAMHDPHSSILARILSIFQLSIVFLASIIYIVSTMPEIDDEIKQILSNIEGTCMILFTWEFTIRLFCAPNIKEFLRDVFNWIDIISIIPFYLEVFIELKGSSIGVIRIMRLIRVTRILKLSRYTSTLQLFIKALSLSAKPLFLLLFLILVAMIIFSSAMYFAELTDSPNFCRNPIQSKSCHPSQNPSEDCCELNPFYSISATFWWCIVSMATVGYGDDYPVTPMRQIVIGSNFQHVIRETMHNAMKQSLDTLSTMQVIQRKEMIEILNGFNILGDGIDVDPDEIIALYDVNKTGRLEDEALEQFRRDVESLHSSNLIIEPPKEVHAEPLSFASSLNELNPDPSDSLAKQLEAMEEILEIRLLESEVRFENKLNGLMKIVSQMERKIALLRD